MVKHLFIQLTHIAGRRPGAEGVSSFSVGGSTVECPGYPADR
jgi:hypothetical protein